MLQTTKRPTLSEIAKGRENYVLGQRHHFHRLPETRWEEEKTLQHIQASIEAMTPKPGKLAFVDGFTSGLVVDYTINPDLPRVLFRADVDALNVTENTNLHFASVTKGKMHACGHDIHTAMLLGAMDAIVNDTVTPRCNIRFYFQRAEENPGKAPKPESGGWVGVREGVTKGIASAHMLHIWALGKPGVFLSRPGALLGNSGRLGMKAKFLPVILNQGVKTVRQIMSRLNTFLARHQDPVSPATLEPVILNVRDPLPTFNAGKVLCKIKITGKGGHVAKPHTGVNVLRALDAIMAESSDATFVAIKAGSETNVMPAEATAWFVGSVSSVRTTQICDTYQVQTSVTQGEMIDPSLEPGHLEMWYGLRTMLSRDEHAQRIDMVCNEMEAVAKNLDHADVTFEKIAGHPALFNDEQNYLSVRDMLTGAGETVEVHPPILGGEDFAHVLLSGVRGSAWLLGAHQEGTGDHHSPEFNPDESVFWKGVLFWLLLATN